MKKKLFYLTIILFAQLSTYAQLSGTKTIGGSGADYSTIAAAVSALHSSGVNGAVVFNIASGTYTEQVAINSISGASATNTITFKSAANDSSTVNIQYASTTTNVNNYIIKFNSAKYITFQAVTMERTGSNINAVVVEFAGTTNHNSINNCVLKNSLTSESGFFSSLVYATHTSPNNISYITFNNNSFINGSIGIYMEGVSSASLNAGAVITNNIFTNQYRWTIKLSFQDAPIINNNTITSTSGFYDYSAIFNFYSENGMQVQNNKISANKGFGIRMQLCSGQSLVSLITNNFIVFSGPGAYGFHYSNSGSHHIYYNSVNLYGSSNTGMYVDGSSSNNIRFQNNIITVGSSGNCMNVTTSTNFPFLIADYNDYYFPSGNMGTWKSSTNLTSLAAWKSASNLDYNSININPNYTSNTNLYITGIGGVSRQGSSALTSPSVSIDIDGDSRHSVKPDIGAHEFSYDDFAIDNIIINSFYCTGEQDIVRAYLINKGNTLYDGIMNLSYQLGGSGVVSEAINISNLMPGDTTLITFTIPIQFDTAGAFNLVVKHLSVSDINPSDDSSFQSINVGLMPSIFWPLDTLICAGNTIILDAGTGMTSYLWSTGATTQTISVDSVGVGLGAKYYKVTVGLNGCSASDSILANFIYCISVDNKLSSKDIQFYPNPSQGKVWIKTKDIDINYADLEVYNSTGQLMYSAKFDGQAIDISTFKSGIYYFRLYGLERQILETIILE